MYVYTVSRGPCVVCYLLIADVLRLGKGVSCRVGPEREGSEGEADSLGGASGCRMAMADVASERAGLIDC